MSISSFCLEQREKEKAALKSILAYSIAGSAALHLVSAFGFALLAKEPSLADNPIEVVVLDVPEPEIKKPELETPKPTPQPVVTPTPEKVVATPTPEPIPTPTPEPIPTATPEPIPTATPEPIPTPKIDTQPTKVEAPKPLETPEEPIKTPTPPEPEKVAETLPPPKIAETPKEELQKPDPQPTKPETETPNTPQPLPTPLANTRDFQERLTQSQPVENQTMTEETPQLPGGLTANQQPPVNNSRVTSQPLESSVARNREFRDRIAANNNSTSETTPGDDNSLMNPGIPGEVSTNRENITNKPIVTSKPLLNSTNRAREFRNSFANSNNSPTTTNSGSDISNGTPGIPGQVTANNQRPNNRPVGGNQPRSTNNSGSPSGTNNPRGRRNGGGGGLRCISECNPEYPPDVENLEGRPVVQFVVEADGSTADAQLAERSGNGTLDIAAVEAVRRMRFAPPDEGRRIVKLAINFATKSGSDFAREARQRTEENERQRRERERQRQENLGLEN